MVTGCGNQESEEDLISYELHAYDATFNHTEEIIVKFDKKGNLKLAQLINEYDPNENAKCQKKPTADEIDDFKYDGVNWECNVDSDYKLKKVWTMTDASIAKGYLKNEEDDYRLPFEDLYPMIETQEKAKEFIENEVNSLKENGIDCNDKYYYVIANEKKCW